jgi:probable DNA repair protein
MDSLNRQYILHLDAGGTVLTANRRQSRIIRRLYDEAQVAAGRHCWPAASVLPLDAWLAAQWQELTAQDPGLPTLMSEAEAAWPWRLSGDRHLDPTLVSVPDLASAARRAWLQLQRHGGSLADLGREPLTRDQRQFLAWSREVEARMAAEGWLDPGGLELAVAAQAHRLGPPGDLLLAGFERPAPALVALLDRLAAAGIVARWASPGRIAGEVCTHAAADGTDETRAWLRWARRRLEARPDARLAIIVPDLQARRAAIERALDAFLQPGLEWPGSRERDRPYDLAGGEPLTAFGVAAAALDALACVAPRVDAALWSRVLRSRYTPAGDAPDPRVRWDVELRRRGLASWTLPGLAARARRDGCPGTAATLDTLWQQVHEGPASRATDDWAKTFGAVLTAWGWPGPGPLASDEYQAAEALRDRLADFARLARTAPAMDLEQARTEFAALVGAPFQPERGTPAVWILDALEPAGVEFDGLWVSGLTAAAWPLPARHEAFLPLPLQRRLGIPGVTAEDCLERALATGEAWRHGAAEVVFSWPRTQDDAEVEPSRALPEGLPALEDLAGFVPRAAAWQQAASLEELDEDAAPRLAGPARGGARILELQAKCPFRAFAELRLDARPLEEPAHGVEPRARGILLHETLEKAWRQLGSHAALARLGPEEVEALVDGCLEEAMQRHLPTELGERARRLEWEWQRAAVLQVLALDRAREPFEIVAVEEELSTELAGLPLRLRVDRVDRVADGLVVLDYKTGRVSTSQWRGARPDAPQLPLYAILKKGDVGGVAFVKADAHAAMLRGVAREAQRLPGMEPVGRFALTDDRERGFDWNQVLERWQAWLTRLARNFQDGEADVDPKLPQTCRHCHLATLCRVSPGFVATETEEEPGHD